MSQARKNSGVLSARALPVIVAGVLWVYLAAAVLYGAMLA